MTGWWQRRVGRGEGLHPEGQKRNRSTRSPTVDVITVPSLKKGKLLCHVAMGRKNLKADQLVPKTL